MKRIVLMMAAVVALAGMAFGSASAHADNGLSYPPGPIVVASPDPVPPGQTVILSMANFCGTKVSVEVTGPETRSFPTASFPAFGFTAPNTPGKYTVTVTGNTPPCPVAIQGLINATATTTFTVVLATTTTAAATSTTAAATTTTAAATTTTAAATTTTAVGSGGPVPTTPTTAAPVLTVPSGSALPVTGSNSSSTLQIALALAAGGAMLLIVARARRQQRTA